MLMADGLLADQEAMNTDFYPTYIGIEIYVTACDGHYDLLDCGCCWMVSRGKVR